MELQHTFDDRQTDTRALLTRGEEQVEHPLLVPGRDAATGIAHVHAYAPPFGRTQDLDRPAMRPGLERILNEIQEGLLEQVAISPYRRQVGPRSEPDLDPLAARLLGPQGDRRA